MKEFCLIILLFCTSCSTIEVYNYYKPIDKQTSWKIEKTKDYTPFYDFITHTYYSCDSLSSIKIEFTNTIESVLTGPPLIPFLPGGIVDNKEFQASISIKSSNFRDTSAIVKGIVIKFNDTLVLKPYYSFIHFETNTRYIEFYSSICDNYSKTNNIIWYLSRYKIRPKDVKTIEVSFDTVLNKQLMSNHQNLKMKSKRKWKYTPFFFAMT